MDRDVIAPLVALTKRAAGEQPSATGTGRDLMGLGAATAGAGFGGQALANRYIAKRPIQSATHELSGSLNELAGLFGHPQAAAPAASKEMALAKLFSRRGGGIGRTGLGIAAAGVPAFMLGRRLDATQSQVGDLKSQVAALLARKQASDFDAIRERLEKSAGIGQLAMKPLQMLGFGARRAAPLAQRAAPATQSAIPYATAVGRQFSPGRAVRTLGGLGAAGGAGALAYGHAQDHAANSTGATWKNPLTWFGGHPSTEDVFTKNYDKYKQMSSGLESQINDAYGSGDFDQAMKLQRQLQSGDFGGGGAWYEPWKWRMGGLNPFTDQNAAYYQQHALGAQRSLQGQYNTEMGKVGPQPGDPQRVMQLQQQLQSPDLLPNQADAIQRQLTALQGRMGQQAGAESPAAVQIRQNMQARGMRHTPFRPGGAPPTGPIQPGDNKPGLGAQQGFAARPGQAHDPWEDIAMNRPFTR